MDGEGECKGGITGIYCRSGLKMHYGNSGLNLGGSSDEIDGLFLTCEGIYDFKKKTCSKTMSQQLCAGDYVANDDSQFCVGVTSEVQCEEYYGIECGKSKVVCADFY